MTERAPSAASLTRRAVERIQDGEIADARLILAEALDVDPQYEPAWLWFAHIAEDPGERRFCLEQAAAANPDSRAKQDLAKLKRVSAVEPPEVADLVPPPLPPDAVSAGPAVTLRLPAPRSRKTLWLGLGALAAVLAAIVAIFALTVERPQPIYVAIVDGGTSAGPAGNAETTLSAMLFFDRINAEGGINGHPVETLVYHDESDPEQAKAIAEQIVADGRALLVIGHNVSSTSLAAGPVYAAAGIVAITPTATADIITADNPWYFRTVFDNHSQGFLIAAYLHEVLGVDRISLISGDADYGKSLAAGIVASFSEDGEIAHSLHVNAVGDDAELSLARAVAELKSDPDPGTVVLAMQAAVGAETVAALRTAGVMAPIMGGDAMGTDAFLASFAEMPPAATGSGFATDGLIAASPLIVDSLTSESLRWFEAFQDIYGFAPAWHGATAYDAAIAAAEAMTAAEVHGAAQDRTQERAKVRDALVALDGPQTAVPGLLGPIYFDATRTTPRTAFFGIAQDGIYVSAPEQLRPYAPTAGLGMAEDMASGAAMMVEDQMLQRERVVFAGVNTNEIGELDTANPSFYADFFLWFRYTGSDDATDVIFLNAVEPDLSLGDPVRTVVDGDTTYRLYHVTGRFKSPLEFQDFPFDRQHLLISFQNRTIPSSELVYAVDREVLEEPQAKRLQSGENAAVSINAIPSWQATRVDFYQDSVGTTSTMGDPEASEGTGGIEYSLFTTDITVERDIAAFLTKNLLPLALLALVTYVSLFFPHTLTEARVTFGVSGILTAAVLLASVTQVLPQIGYTVAIEWGFYAFIVLSAFCIIVGLIGDWLYEQRRLADLRRLDRAAQVIYPLFVIVVVLAYVVRYSGRV